MLPEGPLESERLPAERGRFSAGQQDREEEGVLHELIGPKEHVMAGMCSRIGFAGGGQGDQLATAGADEEIWRTLGQPFLSRGTLHSDRP